MIARLQYRLRCRLPFQRATGISLYRDHPSVFGQSDLRNPQADQRRIGLDRYLGNEQRVLVDRQGRDHPSFHDGGGEPFRCELEYAAHHGLSQ